MYREISKCRVCGNSDLDPIVDLGMQALTGVFPLPGETVATGPLELVKCKQNGRSSCGLVQLRHSFRPEQMYGENYGYRSGLNRSMVSHLESIARASKTAISLASGDVVLDIGSNDATLLKAIYEPGVIAVGMDPTGRKFKEFYPDYIQLIPNFFSASAFFDRVGSKRAKIVSSIAMFYDLENPLEFMSQVREVLAEDGVWIFEQSYLPAMIDSNSYDTICHEHLEYYALKQIVWMAERIGFEVLDIELNAVNGGSFRIVAGHAGAASQGAREKLDAILREEEARGYDGKAVYSTFKDRILRHRDEVRSLLEGFSRERKTVFGYGASTKGNVLLQFCGLDAEYLPCIAEVNPDKFGRVTPGTSIPIVSEQEALDRAPDALFVLPWHFRDDFIIRKQNYLRTGGAFIFPLPQIEIYRDAQGCNNRL